MATQVFVMMFEIAGEVEFRTFRNAENRAAFTWGLLDGLWQRGGFDESEKPNSETEDVHDAWERLRVDDLDSLYFEECNMETEG